MLYEENSPKNKTIKTLDSDDDRKRGVLEINDFLPLIKIILYHSCVIIACVQNHQKKKLLDCVFMIQIKREISPSHLLSCEGMLSGNLNFS